MTVRGIIDGFASGWLVFWLAFFAVYIHFGGLGFAGLVILLGATGWLAGWVHRKHLRREYFSVDPLSLLKPFLAFGLFFVWLAVTSIWGGQGVDTAVRLAAQMLLSAAIPVLILTRSVWTRTLLSQLLMAMALGGVAVLALDVASNYGINFFLDPLDAGGDRVSRQSDAEMNIGRGHVIYAVMLPLFIALFASNLSRLKSTAAAVTMTILLILGAQMNGLAIAVIIIILAAPLSVLGLKSPRWGLRLSLITLAASILFAPLIGIVSRLTGENLMARLPMSWDHRVRMWDYSLTRISEAPLIGKGLDSSRAMQDEFTTRIGVDWPIMSLHPHNVGLQTWMEAGAIGALLLTLAIVTLYRPLRRLSAASPWRGFAVSGLIMSIAVANAVTVGAWQYWWWGVAALALSLVLLIPRGDVKVLVLSSDEIVD